VEDPVVGAALVSVWAALTVTGKRHAQATARQRQSCFERFLISDMGFCAFFKFCGRLSSAKTTAPETTATSSKAGGSPEAAFPGAATAEAVAAAAEGTPIP